MKTLLASAAILSLLAAGSAVAGSKMSDEHAGDGPRMQMSDSYPDRAGDRRNYEKYDDDDRSEYTRGRYDDDEDDREYIEHSQRLFQRMDANGDGMIDRQEFRTHMQAQHRS